MLYNIIFLDIDNVLNYGSKNDANLTYEQQYGFAPELVKNLKLILDTVPDTKIVISSSWRLISEMPMDPPESIRKWRACFDEALGFKKSAIYGEIGYKNEYPDIDKNELEPIRGKGRGDDIADWLNKHRSEVKNFVIIDDNISCGNIGGIFYNNFVCCEAYKGLTEQNAKTAIWILNGIGMEKRMTPNTWFTSDTHFYHGNIIKYCNRPWNSGRDESAQIIVTDDDVIRMNDEMVKRWNETVGKDDIVWHLGDFAFKGKDNIKEIFPKLNGKINLVLGNHDHQKVSFYYDVGFHRVYDRKVIINDFVILSHAPVQFLNDNCPFFNIYGHVHDSSMYKTWSKTGCCVCVERHDYRPVSWSLIEAQYKTYNSPDETS